MPERIPSSPLETSEQPAARVVAAGLFVVCHCDLSTTSAMKRKGNGSAWSVMVWRITMRHWQRTGGQIRWTTARMTSVWWAD